MKTKQEEIEEVNLIKESFLNGTYIIPDRKKSKSNTLSALKFHLKRNGYSGDVLFFVFNQPPECKFCGRILSIEDISSGRQYSYRKCCKDCISNQSYHRIPCSEKKKIKISEANKKWALTNEGRDSHKKQGEYNSKALKKYYLTEKGKARIEDIRKRNSECISEAIRNGSFTPNISNTWTHWDAKVILDGKEYKFRSSWEACFYLSNRHLEYESFRVPYQLQGKEKIYIADFFDAEHNILYEIKPKRSYQTQKEKIRQVKKYCQDNEITFVWINEDNVLDYINPDDIIGENTVQYNMLLKGLGIKNEGK